MYLAGCTLCRAKYFNYHCNCHNPRLSQNIFNVRGSNVKGAAANAQHQNHSQKQHKLPGRHPTNAKPGPGRAWPGHPPAPCTPATTMNQHSFITTGATMLRTIRRHAHKPVITTRLNPENCLTINVDDQQSMVQSRWQWLICCALAAANFFGPVGPQLAVGPAHWATDTTAGLWRPQNAGMYGPFKVTTVVVKKDQGSVIHTCKLLASSDLVHTGRLVNSLQQQGAATNVIHTQLECDCQRPCSAALCTLLPPTLSEIMAEAAGTWPQLQLIKGLS